VSSFYSWTEIPGPIRDSIVNNAGRCGCHERSNGHGADWWLCQYHVGVMDGWEAKEEDARIEHGARGPTSVGDTVDEA
jgi:hypothetical protein